MLTSFGPQDLADMGYECAIADLVALRARKAMEAGMDGMVALRWKPRRSARAPVRRAAGHAGSPLRRAAKGDQKRVATPAEAIRDGADYVVIGRQITRAPDPAAEAARVLQEIA